MRILFYAAMIIVVLAIIRWANRKTILNDIGWLENDKGGMTDTNTGDTISFQDLMFSKWKDIEIAHPNIKAPIKAKKYEPW